MTIRSAVPQARYREPARHIPAPPFTPDPRSGFALVAVTGSGVGVYQYVSRS